jgi:hypothetical protein
MPSDINNRAAGGRIPASRFLMMYFFGPVLIRELEGLTPYLRSKVPDPGASTLPQARFSFRSMAQTFQLELPGELVLPTPTNWKNGREGDALTAFKTALSYAFFADLYEVTLRNPTVKGMATRSLSEGEDWTRLIALMFDGKSVDFERYATYRDMQNSLATLAAGVTLLLTRQTGAAQAGQGGAASAGDILHLPDNIVREIRHQQRYDHLKTIARRANISFGWAIALYCLLHERRGGAAVREAAKKDPETFVNALDALVWGGFAPDYKDRADYAIYRRFLAGDKFEAPGRGRPRRPAKEKKPAAPPATQTPSGAPVPSSAAQPSRAKAFFAHFGDPKPAASTPRTHE